MEKRGWSDGGVTKEKVLNRSGLAIIFFPNSLRQSGKAEPMFSNRDIRLPKPEIA